MICNFRFVCGKSLNQQFLWRFYKMADYLLNSHEKEFLKSNKKMEHHATLKALIIDDEYDICFLLSRILRNNNLDVEFVNSLAEGKAYLTKLKPNLLFLDNHLPDGFGIDFISYVKKEYPGIKIVMVTAHDTNDDRKRALQEGADFFIAKPFSASEIKSAIQQVYPN